MMGKWHSSNIRSTVGLSKFGICGWKKMSEQQQQQQHLQLYRQRKKKTQAQSGHWVPSAAYCGSTAKALSLCALFNA